MALINLLDSFPKTVRKVEDFERNETNKLIARNYDKEFFDGKRVNGYGGYYYDGRWRGVVEKLKQIYGINAQSSVLDIGCAKGFLLYDLQDMIPGISVAGIDISKYAINKAMDKFGVYCERKGLCENGGGDKLEEIARSKVLPFMIIESAEELPYADGSFDVVLSINTIHNLPIDKCKKAIQEMTRVSKNNRNMFIQVDAYQNNEEFERMKKWALTADTVMSADNWIRFFNDTGYGGDYFWTVV